MSEDASAGRLSIEVVGDTRGFRRALEARIKAETRDVRARVKAEIDSRGVKTAARNAAREAQEAAKVRLRVELDTRSLRRDLQAAVDAASEGVRLRLPVDTARIREDIANAVREASRSADATVEVKADTAKARQDIRDAASDVDATAQVGADTTAATAQVTAFRAFVERMRIRMRVDVDRKFFAEAAGLDMTLGKLVGIPAVLEGIGGGLTSLVGGLTAVAGGLFSIVSASGAAVGALAAVPAAVGGLIQTVGTIVVGFRGIGDAVKALNTAEEQGAQASSAAATQRAAAARRVADAQRAVADAAANVGIVEEQAARRVEAAQRRASDALRSVRDAREAAAEAAERGARQVADAEEGLTRAQRDAITAQQGLNDAREEARERLEDLALSLRGAALDEESAAIAVERARERLNRALQANDGEVDAIDVREADLALRQALLRVDEVAERNADLRVEAARAEKAGVDGAANVLTAQERVAETIAGISEAERNLADARRDADRDNARAQERIADAQEAAAEAARGVADAQREAARDVAQAQRAVTDAQRNLADANATLAGSGAGMSAAASAAATAMANLGPNGRSFVAFLRDEMNPALKEARIEVQERFLPYVEDGLRRLLTALPAITQVGLATADSLGGVFVRASELVSSPAFQRDIVTMGEANAGVLDTLGTSGINLIDTLRHLSVEAIPGLLQPFADWTEKITTAWRESAELNRENGNLERFFTRTRKVIGQWARIIRDLAGGLRALGGAGNEAGQGLLDSLEQSTADFRKWAEENTERVGGFFESAAENTRIVGDILVELAKTFGRVAESEGTTRFLTQLRDDLVPALDDLLLALADSGVAEEFLNIIVDIVDLLADLVESGAFEGFVTTLGLFVDAIKAINDNPVGAEVIEQLLTLAGIGGAIGLVAGGVSKLALALTALKAVPGLATLLGLVGIGGGRGKGKGKYAPGKRRGAGGGGARKGPGGRLAAGGIAGFAGSVAGGIAGDAIADGRGGTRDVAGGAVSGLASGAATGALLGSVVPVVGTAVGAAVGGVIGGATGAVQGAGGWDPFMEWFGEFDKELADWERRTLDSMGGWVSDSLAKFEQWGLDADAAIAGWVSDTATDIEAWGTRTDTSIATWASNTRADIEQWGLDTDAKIATWVSDTATDIEAWGLRTDTAISDWASRTWTSITTWSSETWADIEAWGVSVDATIAGWASRTWTTITTWASDTWSSFTGWTSNVWTTFTTWAASLAAEWTTFWWDLRDDARDAIQSAKDWFSDTLGRIKDAFAQGVSNIGREWDALRARMSNPVQFIIDVVYNDGIRVVWNKVAEITNGRILPRLNYTGNNDSTATGPGRGRRGQQAVATGGWLQFDDGGVVPGYTPGRDVHTFYSPTGGRLDLSGGEPVLRPEAGRVLGRSWVDGVNAAARGGGVRGVQRYLGGFAGGGILNRVGRFGAELLERTTGRLRNGAAAFREGVASGASAAGDFVLGGLRTAASKVLDPIMQRAGSSLTGQWGSLLRDFAKTGVSAILGRIGREDEAAVDLGGGQFARDPGRWPRGVMGRVAANTAAAVEYIRTNFGVNNIGTLGSRPNRSDHPMGKALDAMIANWRTPQGKALGTRIAKWFVENASKFATKYVIWNDAINTGSGWRPYTHPNGPTSNPTLRHQDHVHVSFLGDGATVKPRQGGTLAVLAERGRAETVVDTGLLNSRLADMQSLAALTAALQAVAARGGSGVEVHVHPRPEHSEYEIGRMAAAAIGWQDTGSA